MERRELYTNEEIIAGIRDSDEEIISYIYDSYYAATESYILRNSGDYEESRDVFQDALVVVFNLAREDKLHLSVPFGGFLYSVSKLLWLKELRKNSINNRYIEDFSDGEVKIEPEVSREIIALERKKLVLKYFNQLSPVCKQLISHYLKEIPISVTTDELGFSSEQYTRNRQSVCKHRLIHKVRSSKIFRELVNE